MLNHRMTGGSLSAKDQNRERRKGFGAHQGEVGEEGRRRRGGGGGGKGGAGEDVKMEKKGTGR